MEQAGFEREWGRAGHEAFVAQTRGVALADAVAGLVATTAPLVVGAVLDRQAAGLIAALGGLNVALTMGPGRPVERARWGAATVVGGAMALGLATLVHPLVWASVALSAVVVGLGALPRVLGPRGALVGFVVSAVFVIGAGLPATVGDTGPRTVQFLSGGAVALVLLTLAGLGDEAPGPRPAGPASLRDLREAVAAAPDVRGHAAWLGVAVAATTLLYRSLGLDFGYWIPLTTLAVLQPDPHASRVRVVQRASGTVLGCLVVVLAIFASASDAFLIFGVACASFGLFALRERSYHWLVALLTPTALLMISTVDFEGDDIVLARIAYTAAGLLVAGIVIGLMHRLHHARMWERSDLEA